jgi:tetratricopeptide (TPR) repeat protein
VAVEKKNSPSWSWYWVASVLSLLILVVGIVQVVREPHGSWTMLATGCLAVIAVIISWQLAIAIRANRPAAREEYLQPLTERLDQVSILLNLMSEQQLLSDRAISIAYREKDREALRRAVHEELGRHDWDAALLLVDDMERAFGNKAEAKKLRKEITDARNDHVRKQIADVAAVIDKHTRGEQWNAAIREAEKLIAMFPDNEQVRNLPHEIDNRRLAHKKQLMQTWHEAVARHDNDGSIEILKQLDHYLTSAEAESMQETVRSVFKEKLNNLGAQFAAAVKEQRWAEAIRVGDGIVREFPNARIAQEVKESMEALKKRAAEPAAAAV